MVGTVGEYQEAFEARLLTVTKCVPTVAPADAVAVTCPAFDEVTVRAASEPLKLLRSFRSFESVESAVLMEVSAVICEVIVDCWVCHCRSGARAA